MKTQEMCPVRTEISTHKHLGKCIYLLFCWLAVISFRQNYFYMLPNFGYFGAKMSSLYYISNQKPKSFIKHRPPPRVYKETPDIRDLYLYKKVICASGVLVHGGQCAIDKKSKGYRLPTHKIHYSQWKIT